MAKALWIHEDMDGSHFQCEVKEKSQNIGSTDFKEANDYDPATIRPDSLMVEIEAMHAAPHCTRNFTKYMPGCLKKSVPTWTHPYIRPLIKNHDEKNGKTIGRVIEAKYKEHDTFSGTPALQLTVNVPESDIKEEIRNGISQTVSIGVMADDVRCSICGAQLSNGEWCEHERGEVYKNEKTGEMETCCWEIHSMEAKELSYVNVPSDIYAKNVRFYPASSSPDSRITESLNINKPNKMNSEKGDSEEMTDEQKKELEKAQQEAADLKKELAEAKEAAEKLEKDVKDLTEAKEAAEKEVAELKEAQAAAEAEKAEELKLKESLEKDLADTKASLKKQMVESLQTYRKIAGLTELTEDAVGQRSVDSIADSIADVKAEIKNRQEADETQKLKEQEEEKKKEEVEKLPKPGSVASPALAEDDDEKAKGKKQKSLTEGKDEDSLRNIDLRGGLEDIFMHVVSGSSSL